MSETGYTGEFSDVSFFLSVLILESSQTHTFVLWEGNLAIQVESENRNDRQLSRRPVWSGLWP